MKAVVVSSLFAAAVLAGGCSDDGDPPDFAGEFSVRGALAEIPLPEVPLVDERYEVVAAVMTDLVAAAELAGVARPVDRDAETWIDYTNLFFNQTLEREPTPVVVPAIELVREGVTGLAADVYESELGWTPVDIDTIVEVSTFPSVRFDAMTTRADVDALAGVAGDDGVVDVGEGGDGDRVIADRTALRPVGRPLRVAPDPGRGMVAVSRDRPSATAWLAGGGEKGTWADVADLAVVADRLDEREVYSAIVSYGAFDARERFWPSDYLDPLLEVTGAADLEGLLEIYPITEPFTAVGVGWYGAGGDLRTSIVFAFASDAAAEVMVEPIRSLYQSDEPFPGEEAALADFLAVVDVNAAGRTVEVVLDPRPDAFSGAILSEMLLGNGYWLLHV